MQLSVSGRHLEITTAIKEYVKTKFERLPRHAPADQPIDVRVILSVEKIRHKAEANVYIGGVHLFADDVSDDLYKAIDLLTDRIITQATKLKKKLVQRSYGRNHTR